MSYFVTGATGFIGRNLVERLLEREGTIYVLVREGSKGRLEELRSRWGMDEDRVVAVVGDLSQPRLGVSDEDVVALQGRGRPPLPPRGDLRHDRRRREPAGRQRRGHPPHGRARRGDRGRPRPHGQLDRRRRPLQGRSGARTCSTRPRTSTPIPTSGPSTTRRRSCGTSASGRGASTGRGSSSAHSETGEMDKIDGPYYFFKLIRRLRNAVPQWMPMIGVEGREINLVPVDFVARAMDHIAHLDGRDGKAFHLTDPTPKTAGEVIDIFARAAHAPQSFARVPPAAVERLAPLLKGLVDAAAGRAWSPTACCPTSGSRARCSPTSTTRPASTAGRRRRRSAGPTSRVPPLEAYADKLWDYWERHLDPDLFRDRTLVGGGPRQSRRRRRSHRGDRAAGPRRAAAARAAGPRHGLSRAGRARARGDGHGRDRPESRVPAGPSRPPSDRFRTTRP